MDSNFKFNIVNDRDNNGAANAVTQSFMANVFTWMAAALLITGIVAYEFGTNAGYMSLLINESGKGMSILGYVVMFSPFIFVMLISAGVNRFSVAILLALYLVFSALMGMSLSFIFLVYTSASIYKTFAIAGGMFGIMAVAGYTTKTDLSKMGSLLMMAMIGLIIACVVNMFMHSSGFDYIISFIGVIIFTGLTAYDVQTLKNIGNGGFYGQEAQNKLSILGAMRLYMDFINLFLFLLRFFGNRRN